MKNLKTSLPQLKINDATFLAGSGVSVASGLPSGMQFCREISRLLSRTAKEHAELIKLLIFNDQDKGGARIRFEQMIEVFRDTVDPGLRILSSFNGGVRHNQIHEILARVLMSNGGSVFTTNFDCLIEEAFEAMNTGKKGKRSHLSVTCFNEKHPCFNGASFHEIRRHRPNILYKLHGTLSLGGISAFGSSKKSEGVLSSIGATLDKIGSGESAMRLELHKHRVLVRRCTRKTIVIIGYSGLDDFDVIPSLAEAVRSASQLVWIAHSSGRNRIDQNIKSVVPPLIVMAAKGRKVPIILVRGDTQEIIKKLFPSYPYGKLTVPINSTKDCLGGLKLNPGEKSLVRAQLFYSASDYPKSIKYFRKSIRCLLRLNQIILAAKALEFESSACFQLGRIAMAFQSNQQAIDIYQKNKLNYQLAVAETDKAYMLKQIGQTAEALRICVRSRRRLQGVESTKQLASTLFVEASLRMLCGQISKAESISIETIKLCQRFLFHRLEAQGHMFLSTVYRETGRSEAAVDSIRKAQRIYDLLGHPAPRASISNNEGNIYLKRGNLDLALAAYRRAHEIAYKIGRQRTVAMAKANIGVAYNLLGWHKRAIKQFHAALEIDEKIDNKEGIARNAENIAIYHVLQEQWEEADLWFARALRINRKLGNSAMIAISLNNLATSKRKQGDFDTAMQLIKEALMINRRIKRPLGIASTLENIAEIELAKGRVAVSERKAEEAFQLARKGSFIEVSIDSAELCSRIALLQGDRRRAMRYLRYALKDAEKAGNMKRIAELWKCWHKINRSSHDES